MSLAFDVREIEAGANDHARPDPRPEVGKVAEHEIAQQRCVQQLQRS